MTEYKARTYLDPDDYEDDCDDDMACDEVEEDTADDDCGDDCTENEDDWYGWDDGDDDVATFCGT